MALVEEAPRSLDHDELLMTVRQDPAGRHAELDAIAAVYDPSDPSRHFDYWLKRLQADVVAPWLQGGATLELGCATGELASLLAPLARDYVVVEGSAKNVEVARKRLPGVRFVHALWEDFQTDELFNDVILFNALEHIDDPVGLLRRCATWLAPLGRIHAVVPNGMSLHRLVGVAMGLQSAPLDLTPGDTAQGHVRNYTIETLQRDVASAGLAMEHWQGIFLKVVSNRQMIGWDWTLIRALHEVGQRLPEHAAELFAVSTVARV
jgi:trans-aconitate methyltransferase